LLGTLQLHILFVLHRVRQENTNAQNRDIYFFIYDVVMVYRHIGSDCRGSFNSFVLSFFPSDDFFLLSGPLLNFIFDLLYLVRLMIQKCYGTVILLILWYKKFKSKIRLRVFMNYLRIVILQWRVYWFFFSFHIWIFVRVKDGVISRSVI